MPTDQATLPLQYESSVKPKIGNFRWVICALIFFGTTLNYVDRLVLSLVAHDVKAQYHVSNSEYGWITATFSLCYATGQLAAGGWLDRVGTRIGYAVALGAWSVASMLHALAKSALGFGFARAFLGVSESPAYPAATKVLAEWLPKRERALGMGIVNAGSNLGAIIVPIVVPFVVARFGLNAAFMVTGAAGLLFLLAWIPLYRRPERHPRVSPAELAHIQSDPAEPATKISWASLWPFPQTWAFVASKFITDSVWAFLIFFSALFLQERFGLDLKNVGFKVVVIYLLADIGSIGGGWLSSGMMKRGHTVNHSRKMAMLLSALLVVPVLAAPMVSGVWTAVILIGAAMAGHQGFSANQYTIVSDMFPRRAVGSVAGMGGSAGYYGAFLMSVTTGYILQLTHGNFTIPFTAAAFAYLIALGIIHFFSPHLEPARIDGIESPIEPMPPAPAADTLKCRAPGCGYMNREDAKFCRRCGNELK